MLVHTSTRGCMRCARDLEPGRLLYCAPCRAMIDAPQPEERAMQQPRPADTVEMHITHVIADDYYRREVFPMVQKPGRAFVAVPLAVAMRNDAITRAGTAYRAHLKRLRTALRTVCGAQNARPLATDSRQRSLFDDVQHV